LVSVQPQLKKLTFLYKKKSEVICQQSGEYREFVGETVSREPQENAHFNLKIEYLTEYLMIMETL